ncbi:two-component hybrid sensor and regulator [Anopheles sinensis]|uniref:Two-component hybrid sensor and regulator n=1 Tax=Anopheles sinensis TaxID=74873 RepID=A0A084VKI0_ANOSI|nr:two-component hybrid sensor and regulator [Anopheles sinensis]
MESNSSSVGNISTGIDVRNAQGSEGKWTYEQMCRTCPLPAAAQNAIPPTGTRRLSGPLSRRLSLCRIE